MLMIVNTEVLLNKTLFLDFMFAFKQMHVNATELDLKSLSIQRVFCKKKNQEF